MRSFNYDDRRTLLLHFESFQSYYDVCPASALSEYVSRLQETAFIAARNPARPGERFFCKPAEVYFSTQNLDVYFVHTPGVYILDENFYTDFIQESRKEKFYHFLAGLALYIFLR